MRARAPLAFTSAAVFALAGCKDSGLPDRNLPFQEAAHRAPAALVQAVHPETNPHRADAAAAHATMARPVSIGGQTFMPSGGAERIAATSLRTVGGEAGGTFSAAAWDEPPYDRLYLSHPGGLYVSYLPVHDEGGDPGARVAAQHRALEGGAAGAAH